MFWKVNRHQWDTKFYQNGNKNIVHLFQKRNYSGFLRFKIVTINVCPMDPADPFVRLQYMEKKEKNRLSSR